MKIVFLDAKTLGDDIDYTPFEQLGEVVKYPFSTPEEIAGRAKGADVLVVNKVQINARTIPSPRLCHFIENESPRNVVFISISGRFALK